MARQFLKTFFGADALAMQEAAGSRAAYARMMTGAADAPDPIGPHEEAFIAERDSFYLASRTDDGWPYIQHRGGPLGFLKVLTDNRIAFADFSGNKQFITTANLIRDDRVALFLMDYPHRRRLKIAGHARAVTADADPALIAALAMPGYRATVERAIVIDVVGYDWNCPQHIAPRFTEAEVQAAVAPLLEEVRALRAEVERLRGTPG